MNSCTKARQRCSAPNKTSFPWHWTLSLGFVSRLLRSFPLDLSRASSQLFTAVNQVGFSWGWEGVGLPVNEKLNFRVEVRAGTGKVSTADSKPSTDWENAEESSKQTLSMLPVQQPQTFPQGWRRVAVLQERKNHRKGQNTGLPPWKGTRVKWFFIKPFPSGL